MKFELFREVVLMRDIPEKRLKMGDLATIVEYHPSQKGEDGYSLEVFNALGDTLTVAVVTESEIAALKKEEIFSVREFGSKPLVQ